MSRAMLLKAVIDSPTDYAIFAVDVQGRLLHWNASAAYILGLSADTDGENSARLFTEQDQAAQVPALEMALALASGRAEAYRCQKRIDATTFWAEGVTTPIYDDSGNHQGFLKILRDVTNRHADQQNLLHAATTDPLTGLNNRASFHEHLGEWIVAAARAQHTVTLYLIDLDHFKEVNDTFGHQAGDLLLYKIGVALKELTRETDFVARLGGDEFAVLQTGVAAPSDGSQLAQKILDAIGQNFDLNGCEAHVTPSIGIAVAPLDGWTPDELLKKADAALYRVKQKGRNGFSYFTRELDAEAHDRTRDLNALRQSVHEKMFHVVYQPKVSTDGAKLVALEALLRCEHPRLKDKPVGDVIALATYCGVMPRISEWVINETCRQMKSWFDSGFPRYPVCVNLCAREVGDPRMPQMLQEITTRHGLCAKDLIVEITEREMFQSGGGGMAVLQEINALGFSIALDDFGTGYSSIHYLTTLPIDVIKLDIAFVRAVPGDIRSGIAAKGIVNLALSLGIKVVAEGVEREDQFTFFRDCGCEAVQGYYFSRPLAATDMTTWMQNYQRH